MCHGACRAGVETTCAIFTFVRLIDASYEDGSLKLDKPLPLRAAERVAVVVVRKPDPSRWDLARLNERKMQGSIRCSTGNVLSRSLAKPSEKLAFLLLCLRRWTRHLLVGRLMPVYVNHSSTTSMMRSSSRRRSKPSGAAP